MEYSWELIGKWWSMGMAKAQALVHRVIQHDVSITIILFSRKASLMTLRIVIDINPSILPRVLPYLDVTGLRLLTDTLSSSVLIYLYSLFVLLLIILLLHISTYNVCWIDSKYYAMRRNNDLKSCCQKEVVCDLRTLDCAKPALSQKYGILKQVRNGAGPSQLALNRLKWSDNK